jgi:hypothetical protein
MARHSAQQRGNGGISEEISDSLERQRQQVENLAQLLSRQATDQWRKAIEGLVALPAAIAVGYAAITLFAVGFVARGFEVFQRSATEAQRQAARMAEQPLGREQPGQRREAGNGHEEQQQRPTA